MLLLTYCLLKTVSDEDDGLVKRRTWDNPKDLGWVQIYATDLSKWTLMLTYGMDVGEGRLSRFVV